MTKKLDVLDNLIELFETGIILRNGVKCDRLRCSQVVAALRKLQERSKKTVT